MKPELEIYTDGACSGNPGPAAIGFVIWKDGKKIKEFAKDIGQGTNNVAEYTALVYALQEALVQKAGTIKVFTDSELLFKQVTGEYKVKNEVIRGLLDQVQHLLPGFKKVEFQHVPREKNKDADKLATSVLKKKQVNVVAPMFRNHSSSDSEPDLFQS